MVTIAKGWRYLTDRQYRTSVDFSLGKYDRLPDDEFLKLKFQNEVGYSLNLEEPRSFNEKIQWLKLNDRDPRYCVMVDKYRVREYVSSRIGPEYLIPLLGVWDDPKDIDFEKLPRAFVLKCNHNSGKGMYICRDRSKINRNKVIRDLQNGLSEDYYKKGREWPYRDVPRKIICEQFMTEYGPLKDVETDRGDSELRDYKLMCFNGKVKCTLICEDRFSKNGLHLSFYDTDWEEMPFGRATPRIPTKVPRPVHYDTMLELAEVLADGIPFVRVDFYEAGGKIYFGELTFYPGGGFTRFIPEEWDYTLGSWIELPGRKKI